MTESNHHSINILETSQQPHLLHQNQPHVTGSLLETLSLIILFLLITSQCEYSILQNQAASFTDHPERRKKLCQTFQILKKLMPVELWISTSKTSGTKQH